MVIKNKKNGSNVLAFRAGLQILRVMFRAGDVINIPALVESNQIINKADFKKRGWFEIIEAVEVKKIEAEQESNLEKAKKEVKNYTSDDK